MSIGDLTIKALCLSLCLASSLSYSSGEDIARDFTHHVLKIPNPDKILNSVLGRLERNRQQDLSRARSAEEDSDCNEPAEDLPEYTESLQASRERGLRQLGTQKHYPICHIERKIRKLNTIEYEYRPAYYEEIRCSMPSSNDNGVTNEFLESVDSSSPGCTVTFCSDNFCSQHKNNDCWETRTFVIPAGCECMWPVHKLGDMKLHV